MLKAELCGLGGKAAKKEFPEKPRQEIPPDSASRAEDNERQPKIQDVAGWRSHAGNFRELRGRKERPRRQAENEKRKIQGKENEPVHGPIGLALKKDAVHDIQNTRKVKHRQNRPYFFRHDGSIAEPGLRPIPHAWDSRGSNGFEQYLRRANDAANPLPDLPGRKHNSFKSQRWFYA